MLGLEVCEVDICSLQHAFSKMLEVDMLEGKLSKCVRVGLLELCCNSNTFYIIMFFLQISFCRC